MILVQPDNRKREPLFQQIFEQLKGYIESGDLEVGENLPSTRKMAETVGVHRTTIVRAYEELWALGYIESQPGGYSRVRQRNKLVNENSEQAKSIVDWKERTSDAANRLTKPMITEDGTTRQIIDFRPLNPDIRLMPVADFKKCLNKVLNQEGSSLLSYGNALGYLPLREMIAKNMRQHGISASADEVMLTNGIQNGLELIFRSLVNPGETIITESPTYSKMLEMLKYLDIKVIGVPMKDGGMDLDVLEIILKTERPKLLYTIPTFHNPTGISSSQAHRERLLAICEKYKLPILEDGFEEDMKYFGKAIMPIKSMDRNQLVIYVGTFSKILFPGVRIGWAVAPKELIDKLGLIKSVCELSGVNLVQAAMYQFCKGGHYEKHKMRMHRTYRKRMNYALQLCREHLDHGLVHFSRPDGGYLLWFTLKNTYLSETEVIEGLSEAGVLVSAGSQYFPIKSNEIQFRFSVACRDESEIKEGIIRISKYLNRLKQSR